MRGYRSGAQAKGLLVVIRRDVVQHARAARCPPEPQHGRGCHGDGGAKLCRSQPRRMLPGKTLVPSVESVAVQRPPTLAVWRGESTRGAERTDQRGPRARRVQGPVTGQGKDSQTLGTPCLLAPPHSRHSRPGPTPSWWNVV